MLCCPHQRRTVWQDCREMPGSNVRRSGSTCTTLRINLFCTLSRDNGLNYLPMRFWIGMWMSLALMVMVAFDLSALVKYITRFTEESFAMLIALIFIVEAFKKLFHILDHYGVDTTPDIPKSCYCIPPNDTTDSNVTRAITTCECCTGGVLEEIMIQR